MLIYGVNLISLNYKVNKNLFLQYFCAWFRAFEVQPDDGVPQVLVGPVFRDGQDHLEVTITITIFRMKPDL